MSELFSSPADVWVSAWRVTILMLVMLVLAGYAYMVAILRAIQDREASTQQDLLARADELEARTARIAAQVQEEAARLAVEAKARHDRMIEAALKAREAAEATADEVHKLAERTPSDSLMELSADTNVVVHEIKRHVSEEPLQELTEDTNVVVHEIKHEVTDDTKDG